jgi:hypothetical protein
MRGHRNQHEALGNQRPARITCSAESLAAIL